MALQGNIGSLKAFTAKLRELPRTVAIKVAEEAAPVLTEVAKATFAAGENSYGVTWKPNDDGTRATLNKSGGIASGVYYVAIGTKLRVKLAVAYAKYQVGRRPVFPTQNAALPTAYLTALTKSTQDTIRAAMGTS